MPSTFTVVPTNVPGLDQILGGGIPSGSLIMIVGATGTGKTILLQQLAFAWVRANSESTSKALYFSTLSEPHNKLLQHLGAFEFFDPTLLQERLEFLSLTAIMDQGLDKVR